MHYLRTIVPGRNLFLNIRLSGQNKYNSSQKAFLMLCQGVFIFIGMLLKCLVYGETIVSTPMNNYKSDLAYLINWDSQTQIRSSYKETCQAFPELYWGFIPAKNENEACYSPSRNNMVLGTDTWYCANGTIAYYNSPYWMCNNFYVCPDPTWTLSEDNMYCSRDITMCDAKPSTVSEAQLLAAIVYGEASVNSPFEEKAAIANAVIRKRDAYHYASVNELIAKHPGYSAAVSQQNARFRIIMCSNVEKEYPDLYIATQNALDPNGIDYANGGCYWDGYDLKSKGKAHLHYPMGYLFTNPSHNVLHIDSTPPMNIEGDVGRYNYTYQSTAGYGLTVFWKYTQEFISAQRVKQCH